MSVTSITLVLAQNDDGGMGATQAFGWTLFAVLLIGFAVSIFLNMRRGRREVGAELELAANRRAGQPDEELEGPRLERTLLFGLAMMVVMGVGLPLYWLAEPGRQENAVQAYDETFIEHGEALYNEGADCAACHGPAGVGGVTTSAVLNERGEFEEQVQWKSPALDTVLYRYSREEVFEILELGRPNSPMPAWGEAGGGPLTEQQLWNLVDYLESVQLSPEEVREQVDEELAATCDPDPDGNCAPGADFETKGEALFNMGLETDFAAGAYSCGRCHTPRWSWGDNEVPGGGALGPRINDGHTITQFPSVRSHEDFIAVGGRRGEEYGRFGTADGGTMPAFGQNPNADDDDSEMTEDHVMYTPEQIQAVVEYERGL